jgi:O-methyltransferase
VKGVPTVRSVSTVFRTAIRDLLFATPLGKHFLPRYEYNFTPAQLGFLCDCLTALPAVPGSILEIGCSAGRTTIFLNAHMDAIGFERPYLCVDTFSGFTAADVALERNERGKTGSDFAGFSINRRRWFEKTMALNGIRRVRAIEADANSFDYSSLGPVAFCLIDVDLYRPVKSALDGVLSRVSPGGLIAVDDCAPSNRYDGALQAYQEFCRSHSLPEQIVQGKLGLIRKESYADRRQ